MAQLLILFDHVLLAILFLIALFCAISAVSASFYSSQADGRRMVTSQEEEDEEEGDEMIDDVDLERSDTCYSVKNGTSILIESDLKNVV